MKRTTVLGVALGLASVVCAVFISIFLVPKKHRDGATHCDAFGPGLTIEERWYKYGMKSDNGWGSRCVLHARWFTYDNPQLQSLVSRHLPDGRAQFEENLNLISSRYKRPLLGDLMKGPTPEVDTTFVSDWHCPYNNDPKPIMTARIQSLRVEKFVWSKVRPAHGASLERNIETATFLCKSNGTWVHLAPIDFLDSPQAGETLKTLVIASFNDWGTRISGFHQDLWSQPGVRFHLNDRGLCVIIPKTLMMPLPNGSFHDKEAEIPWSKALSLLRPDLQEILIPLIRTADK